MPDPISWYALGRNIGDPTTIDEATDAKILTHNQDPSAHGQSSEAVFNHRIAEILDHVAGCIHDEHVSDISAVKINAGTMLFSRASGGFLNLGGPGQGLGVMRVYGLDGTIRAQADAGGFAVYGGKFLAQDDEDQTFLDAKGIVSTVTFDADINTHTNDQNIGGDFVWTAIDDLAFNIDVSRYTRVMVFGVISWQLSGADSTCNIRLKSGAEVFPDGDGWLAGVLQFDDYGWGTFSFTHILLLPAGETLVKVQAARSTPDETLVIQGTGYRSTFGYIILGT